MIFFMINFIRNDETIDNEKAEKTGRYFGFEILYLIF